MRVLAIETATNRLQIAVGTDAAVDVEVSVNLRRKHVESLVPAVESALAQCGATVHDLDLLVVDRGPGGFTGLRIGVATANALSFACGTPVVGVTSLEVLAASVSAEAPVLAALSAGRGELYWALFGPPGPAGRAALLPPAVDAPGSVSDAIAAALPSPTGLVAVGEGARAAREDLSGLADLRWADPTLDLPQAAWVLRQGLAVPQADWATGTRAAPEPLYIRTHYAEENRRKPTWKARSRRGSGGGAQG